jgi:anti-sigma B factor antagonist
MTSSLLTLSLSRRVAVVTPVGDIDMAAAPVLRQAMADACASAAPLVVLDMARVTFADSTALGVMVSAHKRLAAAGCRLLTVNVPPVLAKALRVTGLLAVLDVWADDRLLSQPVRESSLSRPRSWSNAAV